MHRKCQTSGRTVKGPLQSHVDFGQVPEDLTDELFFPFHREDHWNPHPRVWHRDSYDGHCRHGPGPPAHPQSATYSCPHCKLPPQRQWEHIGRCRPASTLKPAVPSLSASPLPSHPGRGAPPLSLAIWGHSRNGGGSST